MKLKPSRAPIPTTAAGSLFSACDTSASSPASSGCGRRTGEGQSSTSGTPEHGGWSAEAASIGRRPDGDHVPGRSWDATYDDWDETERPDPDRASIAVMRGVTSRRFVPRCPDCIPRRGSAVAADSHWPDTGTPAPAQGTKPARSGCQGRGYSDVEKRSSDVPGNGERRPPTASGGDARARGRFRGGRRIGCPRGISLHGEEVNEAVSVDAAEGELSDDDLDLVAGGSTCPATATIDKGQTCA